MKKKLLALAAVATCLTVNAEMLELESFNRTINVGPKYEVANDAAIAVKKAPAKKVPIAAEDAYGKYVYRSFEQDTINTSGLVEITNGETAAQVTGLLYCHKIAVEATLNPEAGTLTIAKGQKIYTSANYGDILLYLMLDNEYYSTSKDIVFEFDEKGNLHLSNGAGLIGLIASGDYAGYSLASCTAGYDIFKVNGSIVSELVNNDFTAASTPTKEYNTHVELWTKDGVKGGSVYGIDDMTFFDFEYDADNNLQVAIAPSYYYSSTYKMAYPYKGAQSATSGNFVFYTNKGPQGTINAAEGVINLNAWAFAMEKVATAGSYTILNGRKSQSTITFPPVAPTAVNDVAAAKSVASVKYVNLSGQVSATPFEGVNIEVSTYTDGSTKAVKFMK
ncbi:MAG: hypothetical protein ACI30R_02705 [Sodaliphilus sp.]